MDVDHSASIDRSQILHYRMAVPVDLKFQAHCRLSVRPSDIQFEISWATSVATNRLSRKEIRRTVRVDKSRVTNKCPQL
jgi:hypothetical protein